MRLVKNRFCTALVFIFLTGGITAHSQELYVFSEPASNMPAHSLSAKLTGYFVTSDKTYERFSQRYKPEIMFGFSKKWMVHFSATFANMHTDNFGFESYAVYAKYRFLSKDDIHKHFRMAVFADASKTRVPFHYDDISLTGDKSGVELGIIATQLQNKLAVSGTLSHTQVFHPSRNDEIIYVPARNYQSLNYTLSGGYLLLPNEYTDYDQLNVNLYLELIGQKSLDRSKSFTDLGTAVQLIFHSNAKLNFGYRFQVNGNMSRMSRQSWLISFERTFLNAIGKKRR
jgi:hypothetical protein